MWCWVDLCIYPSYYEPWGYTPLEAIAFKVPCITTDLAGFGLWANTVFGHDGKIEDGVKVIHRTDYNYSEWLISSRIRWQISLDSPRSRLMFVGRMPAICRRRRFGVSSSSFTIRLMTLRLPRLRLARLKFRNKSDFK